jgi:hypothetical protein
MATDTDVPVNVEPGWQNRFDGKLVLVLLDNKLTPVIKNGRSLWALQRTLTYRTGPLTIPADICAISVPPGFITDLASIPRWAWIILPPDGPWLKAAIIHDYLYETSGSGVWNNRPPSVAPAKVFTRRQADAILREGMQNRGVGPIRRTIIYLAVRIGGWAGWGPSKKRQADDKKVADFVDTD